MDGGGNSMNFGKRVGKLPEDIEAWMETKFNGSMLKVESTALKNLGPKWRAQRDPRTSRRRPIPTRALYIMISFSGIPLIGSLWISSTDTCISPPAREYCPRGFISLVYIKNKIDAKGAQWKILV
jgi:hypothetical protein